VTARGSPCELQMPWRIEATSVLEEEEEEEVTLREAGTMEVCEVLRSKASRAWQMVLSWEAYSKLR